MKQNRIAIMQDRRVCGRMLQVAMTVIPKSKCGGCSACALLCPVDAINMKCDRTGFRYPVIDKKKCIECGKCLKICPALQDRKNAVKEAFVGRHQKRDIVRKSTSGGAFTLLSDEVLSMQGVIYGVAFDNNKYIAYYTRAVSEIMRNEMRQSKYVEAKVNSIYRLVRKDLINNKIVLFVGTPCHVAGLKAYCSDAEYGNLYTIDLLCSNVCSSKFLIKYIKLLEKFVGRRGKRIEKFLFRDETRFGWKVPEESFFVGKRKVYMHLYSDLYYSRIFSRPSCDACIYRDVHREGDISIGDAWGYKKRDTLGTSIVLCNTEKGQALFNRAKEKNSTIWEKVNLDDYLQTALVPQKFTVRNREKIWKHIDKHGLLYVLILDIGYDKIKQWINQKKRKVLDEKE